MAESGVIDFIPIKNSQLSIIQGFLASIQEENGSWKDLPMESSLILEQFLISDNSKFIKTRRTGTAFILNQALSIAKDILEREKPQHSLDSDCTVFGRCFQIISLVPEEWKYSKDLLISTFKKLENTLGAELESMNSYGPVISLLYCYAYSDLLETNDVTNKMLTWSINKILSKQTEPLIQAAICACIAKLNSKNNTWVEEIWNKIVSQRIDNWKETSPNDALNTLIESVYTNIKNQLSANYTLLKQLSMWSMDCKNTKIQEIIQKICYDIDTNSLFVRMFDYLKKPDDSLLLQDLANYFVAITLNKLDLVAIKTDKQKDILNALEVYGKKSQNFRFLDKWKINTLVFFTGFSVVLSSILISVYLQKDVPWFATIPMWAFFLFLLTKIYK